MSERKAVPKSDRTATSDQNPARSGATDVRILTWADYFAAPSPSRDPELVRRTRLLVLVGFVGGAVGIAFGAREWFLFRQPLSCAALLAAGAGFLLVPWLIRHGNTNLAGTLSAAAPYLGLFAVAWVHGGVMPTVLMWGALIPLYLAMTGRSASAYRWGALVLLQYVAIGLASQLGVPGISKNWQPLVPLSGFLVVTTLLSYATDTIRQRLTNERIALEHRIGVQDRLDGIGHLAAGVAHDFNNLLTVIRGSARTLLEELPPDSPLTPDAAAIEEAASRGAAIVRRLLAFRTNQELPTSKFNLAQGVRSLEPLLRRLTPFSIELEVQKGPSVWVEMAPEELEQILVNLVVNAREVMPSGGRIEVSVRARSVDAPDRATERLGPGNYAVLAVRDTGPGVPDDVLPHLFEPFFTTRGERGGTGLGLASVHRIVERAHGDITVETKLQKGTAFEVWLPEVTAPAEIAALEEPSSNGMLPLHVQKAPEAQPPREPLLDESGGILIQGTVGVALVVDDQPAILRVARRLLRKSGFEVLTAGSGEEALPIIRANAERIDFLLTDVMMPEMSGATLAGEFRRLTGGAPVLYMSGFSHDAEVAREVDSGLALYLHKPFSPEEFRAAVAHVLGQQRVA